jgi:acetyltransferase-like isoleucine patch superfamily enzyme
MLLRIIEYFVSSLWVFIDVRSYARAIGVQCGENVIVRSPSKDMFGSEPYLIKIGNNVTISYDVDFITHDGGIKIFRGRHPDIDVMGPIEIGNDVFIGAHVILLPGVKIGDNSVVGAGSVVTHDVLPNSVVAGVPARRIKSIDEYWENIKDRTLPTYFLNPKAKRQYLEDRFFRRSQQSPGIVIEFLKSLVRLSSPGRGYQ